MSNAPHSSPVWGRPKLTVDRAVFPVQFPWRGIHRCVLHVVFNPPPHEPFQHSTASICLPAHLYAKLSCSGSIPLVFISWRREWCRIVARLAPVIVTGISMNNRRVSIPLRFEPPFPAPLLPTHVTPHVEAICHSMGGRHCTKALGLQLKRLEAKMA